MIVEGKVFYTLTRRGETARHSGSAVLKITVPADATRIDWLDALTAEATTRLTLSRTVVKQTIRVRVTDLQRVSP